MISQKKKIEFGKQVAMDSLILYTDVGYRFAFAMALLMMGVTITVAIYAVAIFIIGTPIEGSIPQFSFFLLRFLDYLEF